MSSRDHPDWWRPTGGQNSQDSILERRSLIWNDDGVVAPTVPDNFYTEVIYKGKFFTRGCRGMIESIQVYCEGNAFDDLTIRYSPHPCLGPINEVTIQPAVGWAWQDFVIEEMWDYDSLFIWIHECDDDVSWAYDAELPFDGHEYTVTGADFEDLGATWEDMAIRPFIRTVYTGETPGDVPVSGILNIIPIPSSSSETEKANHIFLVAVDTSIIEIEGAGYCDYVKAIVIAGANSHETRVTIHCDGVRAFREYYVNLNTHGHTTSTPTVSLSTYAEDGLCVMLIHKRFEFRRRFEVRARNAFNGQQMTVHAYPTLVR